MDFWSFRGLCWAPDPIQKAKQGNNGKTSQLDHSQRHFISFFSHLVTAQKSVSSKQVQDNRWRMVQKAAMAMKTSTEMNSSFRCLGNITSDSVNDLHLSCRRCSGHVTQRMGLSLCWFDWSPVRLLAVWLSKSRSCGGATNPNGRMIDCSLRKGWLSPWVHVLHTHTHMQTHAQTDTHTLFSEGLWGEICQIYGVHTSDQRDKFLWRKWLWLLMPTSSSFSPPFPHFLLLSFLTSTFYPSLSACTFF